MCAAHNIREAVEDSASESPFTFQQSLLTEVFAYSVRDHLLLLDLIRLSTSLLDMSVPTRVQPGQATHGQPDRPQETIRARPTGFGCNSPLAPYLKFTLGPGQLSRLIVRIW